MKNKNTYYISGSLLLSILIFYFIIGNFKHKEIKIESDNYTGIEQVEKSESEMEADEHSGNKPSGIMQSLQFLTQVRAFPENDIPADKYNIAFEQTKQMQSYDAAFDSPTQWTSIGPNNIGGRSLCMEFSPVDTATLYMGSASGGLWKTTTGGLGANAWQRIKLITFPMIRPSFTISLFLTLSNSFKLFDQNLALTNGGPGNATQMLALNIYQTAFSYNKMNLAQAKAVIFFVFVCIITLVQVYMTKKDEVEA